MVLDRGYIPRHGLPAGAWAALDGAFDAMVAGGLPCGAALTDHSGAVIERGRNHAYDASDGGDVLEGTPLAHAEMNVLARVPIARDLSTDTLWSTQQPCAMCAAALSFCGVGHVRFLAVDPAFVASGDARGGTPSDPIIERPEWTVWAIFANALFLQPAVARGDAARLDRNHGVEPETVEAATTLSVAPRVDGLAALVNSMWDILVRLSDQRRERLDGQA